MVFRCSHKILSQSQAATLSQADFSHLQPKIVKTKADKAYYIRQRGYDRRSFELWQKMIAWVYTNDIEEHQQIGIYHDNPIITPLQECNYVACIVPKDDSKLKNTNLPSFDIESVICATFEVKGKYGDILKLIQWIYHHWLPDSGFEATTIPSYTIFRKNHFLSEDGLFEGTHYVPVRYV